MAQLEKTNDVESKEKLLEAGTLEHLEMKEFLMDGKKIDKNCHAKTWSNCDSTTIDVRKGPNYEKNRKKAPSQSAMYTVFAVDTYRVSNKVHKIWKHINLDDKINQHIKKYHSYSPDKWPLPPIIVINVMIPNYNYGEGTQAAASDQSSTATANNNNNKNNKNNKNNGKNGKNDNNNNNNNNENDSMDYDDSNAIKAPNNSDGDGISIVVYAELSDEICRELEKLYNNEEALTDLTPAIALFSKFAHACSSVDLDGTGISLEKLATLSQTLNAKTPRGSNNGNSNDKKEDGATSVNENNGSAKNGNPKNGKKENGMIDTDEMTELLSRFKVIVRLMNYGQSKLPYLVWPIVSKYNGKPFLARTTSTFYHVPGKYFGADIDAHNFKPFTRMSFDKFRGYMDSVIFDAAFVIEAKSDNELPERLLCNARISKIGADAAKPFPIK